MGPKYKSVSQSGGISFMARIEVRLERFELYHKISNYGKQLKVSSHSLPSELGMFILVLFVSLHSL